MVVSFCGFSYNVIEVIHGICLLYSEFLPNTYCVEVIYFNRVEMLYTYSSGKFTGLLFSVFVFSEVKLAGDGDF